MRTVERQLRKWVFFVSQIKTGGGQGGEIWSFIKLNLL
jgi:hypothetical protein